MVRSLVKPAREAASPSKGSLTWQLSEPYHFFMFQSAARLFLPAAFLCLSSQAMGAEYYSWIDPSGTMVITDNAGQIPPAGTRSAISVHQFPNAGRPVVPSSAVDVAERPAHHVSRLERSVVDQAPREIDALERMLRRALLPVMQPHSPWSLPERDAGGRPGRHPSH